MANRTNEMILGSLIIGGIGYCAYSASKMNDMRKELFDKVGNLSDAVDVDISEALIEKAVDAAVKREADRKVSAATQKVVSNVTADIQSKVSKAVNDQYKDLKWDVEKELKKKVGSINVSSIREDVLREAKRDAISNFKNDISEIRDDAKERYEDAVDDAIDEFKDKLDDVLDGFDDNEDLIRLLVKSMVKRNR